MALERLKRLGVAMNLPILMASAALLASIYLFFLRQYLNYFPFGDEPAGLEGSNQGVVTWFTRGFSDVFTPFPQWTVPDTDFMRPGSSLVLRVNQMLFRQHYALYFAEFYLLQLASVWLVTLIAKQFGLPGRWLSGIALLTAINPAFINERSLTALSGSLDLWVGFLSLFSFFLLQRQRYLVALIPLTVGVFVKETAIVWPMAACLAVYVSTKRKFLSVVFLSPLFVWVLIRQLVFEGSILNVYALPLQSTREFSLLVIKGILNWPTGLAGPEAAKRLLADHSIRTHLPDVLIFATNALLWALLILIVWLVAGSTDGSRRVFNADRRSLLPLVIWTSGALGFGILAPSPAARFGASIYSFEILLFAIVCYLATNSRLRTAGALALALLSASFLWQARITLHRNRTDPSYSMRQLVTALQRYGGGGETIFILNSALSYSTPSYIAMFSGIHNRLVILTEFDGCVHSAGGETAFSTEGGKTVIETKLPPCARVSFPGVPGDRLVNGLHGTLARGELAEYSFPDGRIASITMRSRKPVINFGKRIRIALLPDVSGNAIILYYDWRLGRFESRSAGVHPPD